ncbi:hypothetical protein T484DRAFT_1975058 [Baffinella frigidus]|nr:hypothetical protein T484DRAFT_1975058 [Cryptophyta sp. CCMP2293]
MGNSASQLHADDAATPYDDLRPSKGEARTSSGLPSHSPARPPLPFPRTSSLPRTRSATQAWENSGESGAARSVRSLSPSLVAPAHPSPLPRIALSADSAEQDTNQNNPHFKNGSSVRLYAILAKHRAKHDATPPRAARRTGAAEAMKVAVPSMETARHRAMLRDIISQVRARRDLLDPSPPLALEQPRKLTRAGTAGDVTTSAREAAREVRARRLSILLRSSSAGALLRAGVPKLIPSTREVQNQKEMKGGAGGSGGLIGTAQDASG